MRFAACLMLVALLSACATAHAHTDHPVQDEAALHHKVEALEVELARVSQLQKGLQASLASLASGLSEMNLPGGPRQGRRMLAHDPEAPQHGRALRGDGCINRGLLSPTPKFCCSGKAFFLICV